MADSMHLGDLDIDISKLSLRQQGAILTAGEYSSVFYSQKTINQLREFIDSGGKLTIKGRLAAVKILQNRSEKRKAYGKTEKA
jgi:hypothetical protein